MSKFLLLLLFGVLLYLVFVRGKRLPRGRVDRSPPTAEAIIECAYCHLYLPLSESVAADGRRYCCEEHRHLGED